MGYSEETIKKVEAELEQRRRHAEDKANANTSEVYEKCPEIKELDRTLSLTGLNVYKAAVMGKDGLEERIETLKNENLALQKKRKKLLCQNGFPEDYTDVRYTCSKCSDTGYIGIEMCDCKRKALAKAAFEGSGLGKSLGSQSFENFDLTYYSDKPSESGGCDREIMKSILEKAKRYVSDFGDSQKDSNLLFMGKTGLGKTHITTAIAKGVIERGYDVVYDSAQNIIREFEMQRFERDENAKNNTDRFFSCDLLILDDLGTEFKNSFTQSVLYNLINTRINDAKPMIFSTNLDDIAFFRKTYDDRITSRFIGSFRTFHFVGTDIRVQMAKNAVKNK